MLIGQRSLVKGPDGQWVAKHESFAHVHVRVPIGKPPAKPRVAKVKAPRDPKPVKGPYEPINDGRFTILDLTVWKGLHTDKPYINSKGKESNYMLFKIPIVTIIIRGNHWIDGHTMSLRWSRYGLCMVHPNGEKTKIKKPDAAKDELFRRFGADTGDTLRQLMNI